MCDDSMFISSHSYRLKQVSNHAICINAKPCRAQLALSKEYMRKLEDNEANSVHKMKEGTALNIYRVYSDQVSFIHTHP